MPYIGVGWEHSHRGLVQGQGWGFGDRDFSDKGVMVTQGAQVRRGSILSPWLFPTEEPQKVPSQNRTVGVQEMPPQNMPLGYIDYFEL